MSSNVSLKTIEWNLLLGKQFLVHLIPSQEDLTDQKDERNVCIAGEIHHMHVIAALLEMPNATDVARWAILKLCDLPSH